MNISHKILGITIISLAALVIFQGKTHTESENNYSNVSKDFSLNSLFTEDLADPQTEPSEQFSTFTPEESRKVTSTDEEVYAALASNPEAGTVTTYQANNKQGTAIVFLQRHKAPGSTVEDPVNDEAVVAQQQISDMITALYTDHGVNTILVEGKQNGEEYEASLQQDLAHARQQLANVDHLTQIIEDLSERDDIPASVRQALQTSGSAYVQSIYREVLLDSAAMFAYAQGNNIRLVGAEDPETYKKSSEIVIEYMQLSSRLNELSSPLQSSTLERLLSRQNAQMIDIKTLLRAKQKMMQRQNQTNAPDSLFALFHQIEIESSDESVDTNAKQGSDLVTEIQEDTAKKQASIKRITENPYANVQDRQQLSQRLETVSAELENTVVHQRNEDTAENFVKMLQTENTPVGMIQFGAQHKDGLVEELLKRNISVITITPKSMEMDEIQPQL